MLAGRFRRSLRARLVGYLLVLSLVTVGVMGFFVNERATEDLRANVLDQVNTAADSMATVVERWLEEQRRTVTFTAGLFDRASSEGDQLRSMLSGGPEADEARETVRQTLSFVIRQTVDAQELMVLDLDGTIQVSSFEGHDGTDQSGEEYFQRGTTSTGIEGVFTWELTDSLAIAAVTPLELDGEPVGVLAAMLDLSRLHAILIDQAGLGGTGSTILVSSDHRQVRGRLTRDPGQLESEGIDAALAGTNGQGLYVDHQGTPVIGAYRFLEAIDAALVAEISQAEAFAPARELAALIGLVGLGSAALLVFGIWVISGAIARPILALASTASRVADGDLDASAPVTSEDEVGTLGRAFNAMTAQLRESMETLEHRVAERTAELQQRNNELAIVNEVGQALAKQLDFNAILEAVGDRAAEALNARGLSIAMKDPETGVVTFRYWIDQGKRNRELEGMVLNDELTSRILETGQAIHIRSAEEAERLGTPFKVEGTESYLGVPIPAGDQSIGVIAIGTHEPDSYSEDDRRLLTTLATNMGVALDNARLFGELNAALHAQVEAEARYRRLVEELPLALYIDNPDERAQSIYVNPATEVMFGYPLERWYDEGFFETIIHPDDREKVLANHMEVFERGDERWTWEYRLMHADGRALWIHDEAVIVRDETGTPQYVQGFLIDVTEEREASARLAEANAALGAAEARYRQLVEELPLVLYIDRADASATSTYISPQVVRLAGYPMERWLEEGFFESIIHPDDRERVLAEQTVMFRTDGAEDRFSTDYRLLAADGRTVWIRDDGRLIKSEDGTPSHVQGFMLDITEEREAAAEVRRQKTYFEALVEANPVAIVVMGRDEHVTAWNPAAERLFGYGADEAVGRHIDDLIFSEDRRAEGTVTTTEAREKGRSQRIGQRMRTDGHLVDVEIVVVPLMLDGEHVGYYAIYHDISELEEARKAAEAANQAKSAFLAAMSHEIRTPMNAIIGMSGLLVDTKLNDEQRDYAETIRTSGDALLTIINDILDFSKIEAGKVELDEAPFSLAAVIEGALDVLAPAAAAKGIELVYEAPDQAPPALIGDAGRLRQILLNLLSNAVKFTGAGEVVLTASGSPLPDGRWEGTVEVRDTGIGIPPDRLGQLFQSFSQLDASVSRRYGGTGLGLAISRRLAELMDGSLMATSSGVEGEGSTFRLRFRASPAADGAVAAPTPREPGILAGKRVLIVDDNATNRRILVAQTSRWGMEPVAAAGGPEALGMVEGDGKIDVALLDLNMPELDGIALAERLRTVHPDPVIPIIILSSIGAFDRGDAPVVGTLAKPVKPSALHDALADALGGGVEADGATTPEPEARVGDEHPLRILLAEDNAVNRKLALKLLERMGYTADVATNGVEAVEAVSRHPYDVVLMDVQMPELDGLGATQRIRAAELSHPQPQIVAMTANAMAGDREACLAAGMDDYLSKPIRPPDLEAALVRAAAVTAGG